MRTIALFAALLAIGPLFCQAPPERPETVIAFKLHPAALPRPALKYKLLPEIRQVENGNAIQGFMKCFAGQNAMYHGKESLAERERLNALPFDELPADIKGNLVAVDGSSLNYADLAARMDHADWQILDDMRRDGFETLLPDLQQMRALESVLKVRTRFRLKAGEFNGSFHSLQTQFALGRFTGQHPCVIGTLVGVAITMDACKCLEEWPSQKGAPNLFWAYQHLPKPMFDMRYALEAERWMLAVSIGDKLDRREPMSQDKLDAVMMTVRMVGGASGESGGVWQNSWKLWLFGKTAAIRKRLAASGVSMETSAKMPPLQVILLDYYDRAVVHFDDEIKLFSLPYPRYTELVKAREVDKTNPLSALAPTLQKVRIAVLRAKRTFAMLQIVEAIRAYMSGHDGKFPLDLAAIELPLPNDPFTLKPFEYSVKDGKANLSGPRFENDGDVVRVRYEMTAAK